MDHVAPHISKQMTFSPKPGQRNAMRDFDETPVGPKSKAQNGKKTKKKPEPSEDEPVYESEEKEEDDQPL